MMTMGMAATASMTTKMTAGVPSKQAVSAAEVCLVRTSAEALRRMATAKQVKAARAVCLAGVSAGKRSSLPKPLTTIDGLAES
jgi:hypothetical protein